MIMKMTAHMRDCLPSAERAGRQEGRREGGGRSDKLLEKYRIKLRRDEFFCGRLKRV